MVHRRAIPFKSTGSDRISVIGFECYKARFEFIIVTLEFIDALVAFVPQFGSLAGKSEVSPRNNISLRLCILSQSVLCVRAGARPKDGRTIAIGRAPDDIKFERWLDIERDP